MSITLGPWTCKGNEVYGKFPTKGFGVLDKFMFKYYGNPDDLRLILRAPELLELAVRVSKQSAIPDLQLTALGLIGEIHGTT